MASNKRNLQKCNQDENNEKSEEPDLKKMKSIPEVENKTSSKPREKWNFMKHLRERQVGNLSVTKDIKVYPRSKFDGRTLIKETKYNETENQAINSVQIIKPFMSSICGTWVADKNASHPYVMGQTSYEDFIIPQLGFHRFGSRIIDICDNYKSLVYIYRDPVEGYDCFDFLWRSYSGTGFDIFQHFHSNKYPLYCCSSTVMNHSPYLAVGTVDGINVYNLIAREGMYRCCGRVETVLFSETGHYFVSGLHNGKMVIHDRRASWFPQLIVRISEYSLTDSIFIAPEKIVMTGFSNKLREIDLRTRKVVTKFHGHHHSIKKLPLSYVNGLLCASGSDNVVRIWDRFGGNPVQEIGPSFHPHNKQRGLLRKTTDATTNLYVFEEDKMRLYDLNINDVELRCMYSSTKSILPPSS